MLLKMLTSSRLATNIWPEVNFCHLYSITRFWAYSSEEFSNPDIDQICKVLMNLLYQMPYFSPN